MKTVKVWDLFVRLFHWLLVAGIISQLVTAEHSKNVHVSIGYIIIILLILRFIWGIVGSRHARFTDFIYSPVDVLTYLKRLIKGRPRHYIGHNPAGGAMVCALLVILLLTGLTGLITLGAEGKGPLARYSQYTTAYARADDHPLRDDDDASRHGNKGEHENDLHSHAGNKAQAHYWKEVHEILAGISLFLIGLHICGVLASSYVHRENLILAMITGKKKEPDKTDVL
jgi:cytochrome b